MATSFAAFASQYLNKNQAHGSSSLTSSQPLFFSFTDDGSRALARSNIDDGDDPHLRALDDDRDLEAHQDSDDDEPAGWLAHQATPLRSPSPPPSDHSTDDLSDSPLHRPALQSVAPPPLTSLSLTESLLPHDGTDVFSLPDPRHVSRSRRRYHDSIWTTVYLTLFSLCLLGSLLLLILARRPKPGIPNTAIPYMNLLHTIPLLTILTFTSAAVAYIHVWLLRVFVKPVMIGTSVFIPSTLFLSALWAFIGSFMWDGDKEPTWGETVGLRLFSLIPLGLSLLTARRLANFPRQLHSASSLLSLSTNLLISHPFVLALSPVLLLATLLISIPFVTLIFRLLLIGYPSKPPGGTWEWHIKAWADWAIAGAICVWLWTWGIARGILRVSTAGAVGAWYFADQNLPPPPPFSTHTTHAALFRATQPSLGTVIFASLLLTLIRMLTAFVTLLRMLPYYVPVVTGAVAIIVGYAENTTSTLSAYALVYVGLTGDPFLPSARRARTLVAMSAASSGSKRRFKIEPPLTLLTIAPLTLAFPFALITYIFVAHTLGAPDSALGAALLAGGVTSLVGKFCIGVVRDTADTLYVCYCIDKDIGEKRRPEVFNVFEYEIRPRPSEPDEQTRSSRPSYASAMSREAPLSQDSAYRGGPLRPTQPLAHPSQPGFLAPTSTSPRMPLASPSANDPTGLHLQSGEDSELAPSPPSHRPTSTAGADEDIDPFYHEQDPSNDSERNPVHSQDLQRSYGVRREDSLDDSDIEDQEEEQLFPGSDFF